MCTDCLDEDALHDALGELHQAPSDAEPEAYLYACTVSELPQNGSRGKVVVADHDEIALFYLQEQVYAISNICPHQLSPLLAEGHIDKQELTTTCPLHGWCFHIPTGKFVGGAGHIKTYQVKVLGEEVWVEEPKPLRETSDSDYEMI